MKRFLSLGVLALALACGRARSPEFDPAAVNSQALTKCAAGTTLAGIDVSHWDGTIDWHTVATDGGQVFAFMKATEGTSFTDPMFAANWAGAGDAGVARSPYHFFRASDDPTMQAQYFLSVIGPQSSGDLPTMLDLETLDGQTGATVSSTALTWLGYVKAQTGRAPIVYTSASFMSGLSNTGGFSDYPLFVANWGVTCPDIPSPWTNWLFWQFTDSATIAGVPDPSATDADELNGGTDVLAGLLDAGAGTSSSSSSGATSSSGTSSSSGATSTGGTSSSSSGATSTGGTSSSSSSASSSSSGGRGSSTGTASSSSSTTGSTATTKSGCGCNNTDATSLFALFAGLGVLWPRRSRAGER